MSVGMFATSMGFLQEITHEKNLVGCEEPAGAFVRTLSALDDRLGPLLAQLPPSFAVEGRGILEEFLADRHRASDTPSRCVTSDGWDPTWRPCSASTAQPTLIDYPLMPRMEQATAGFIYIRWLGGRRGVPSGHTHAKRDRAEDLGGPERVDRFLSEGREVFAYANNHCQNHSPSTLDPFVEIRRGR